MVQGLLTRMLSLMASLHFKTLKTILATCQFLHTVQLLVFPYKNMEIIIIMIIPSLGIKWRKPTADQGWKPMMVRCGIPPSARRWKPTAGRSWKPTTARCWFCNRGPLLVLQPRPAVDFTTAVQSKKWLHSRNWSAVGSRHPTAVGPDGGPLLSRGGVAGWVRTYAKRASFTIKGPTS